MKHVLSGLAFAAMFASLLSGSALAQLSDQQLSELQNSRITVVYEPPTLPRFQALYERLQQRRVL